MNKIDTKLNIKYDIILKLKKLEDEKKQAKDIFEEKISKYKINYDKKIKSLDSLINIQLKKGLENNLFQEVTERKAKRLLTYEKALQVFDTLISLTVNKQVIRNLNTAKEQIQNYDTHQVVYVNESINGKTKYKLSK